MRLGFHISAFLLLCAALAAHGGAASRDYAVQLSASVQATPPQITLRWTQDDCATAGGFIVRRKSSSDRGWGKPVELPGDATSYTDDSVTVGSGYEYQVIKLAPGYTASGYLYSGIDVPISEARGKLLLVVDNTHAEELSRELTQLQQDLAGDGWHVIRLDVNRNDPVTVVKGLIKAEYRADPKLVRCVFLFGHVPVPYSGNVVPDGHAPEHQGAWPCDGYYADMDGNWTDRSVTVTCASDPRNWNVPGDGKFDQSSFPAPLRLMIGRVDLANMPGRLSPGGPASLPSEVELLRNYLRKNHEYRQRRFELPRRGVVGDYFGPRDGEAFAASGWRNFSSFFGPADVSNMPEERTWISHLSTNAYLWAYGCGPGTYTSIGGLGTNAYNDGLTTEMVAQDVKAAFCVLFGSWLGDWDAADSMLRSVLATRSYGLTAAWSGRPHWFFHHMALGAPIGYSTRLTQNNGPGGLYRTHSNNGAGQIQIALMGDPTLRMHMVAPPEKVTAVMENPATTLSWAPSPDHVLGYHIYRASQFDGSFERLNRAPITGTSFTDTNQSLTARYMVRAIKREISGSGTYINLSHGAFAPSPEVTKPSMAGFTREKREIRTKINQQINF